MKRAAILERVREIVSDVLGVAVTEIDPDDRLIEDLEAERTQCLELADVLEDEFDVEVDEDELLTLGTVGEVAEMIAETVDEEGLDDFEEEEEEDYDEDQEEGDY